MRYEIIQEYIQHWFDESRGDIITYEHQTALMLKRMRNLLSELWELLYTVDTDEDTGDYIFEGILPDSLIDSIKAAVEKP